MITEQDMFDAMAQMATQTYRPTTLVVPGRVRRQLRAWMVTRAVREQLGRRRDQRHRQPGTRSVRAARARRAVLGLWAEEARDG